MEEEEEVQYSSVVFKNGAAAPREKKEEATVYDTVKPSTPATTATADGRAAALHSHSQSHALVVSLVIAGVLLLVSIVAIIYLSVEMNRLKVNLSDRTAENRRLIGERTALEVETEKLSNSTDNLNWTLNAILTYKTFPVSEYCSKNEGCSGIKPCAAKERRKKSTSGGNGRTVRAAGDNTCSGGFDSQTDCDPCLKGWTRFQLKCYLFFNADSGWMTWDQSRTYCRAREADLVVIDDLQEQEFVSGKIQYYYDEYHGYWIGLKEMNDSWFWIDGRDDTLGYWTSIGESGACALMMPNNNVTANWDPANCGMKSRLVCERDVLIRTD